MILKILLENKIKMRKKGKNKKINMISAILSGMREKTAQEVDMASLVPDENISSLADAPSFADPQSQEEEYINIEDLSPEQMNAFAHYYPEEFASYFKSGG